jgi:hypothetical protein
MTHEIWHVICGTGGTPVTDKTITLYDAPFSVAIKIDVNEFEAQAIAAGMSPAKARKRADRFTRMVEADWEKWGDFLEDKLCIEYTRHEPHAANFPDQ